MARRKPEARKTKSRSLRLHSAEASSSKSPPLVVHAAIVFAAALVVRLIYAAQVSGSPLFQSPTMDAGYYYALARQFTNGRWLHPVGLPYWQPPAYSALLAVWMKLAGTSIASVKNAQFVLGSVNCVLTLVLGTRLLGRTIGLIAGLAAAFYAPMIYFDGELLTPTLQIFLNLLAILAVLSAVEKRSLPLFAAAGLLLGLSLVVRPDVLVFAVALAIWVTVSLRKQVTARQIGAAVALMLICAGIPVVPVAIRNRAVGKDQVLISANGGINFYIGNNPDYDRTVAIRPGPDWDAMAALPRRGSVHATSSEQSAYFYRRALAWAIRSPLEWAALTFKKAVIYLTAVEGRRDHDIYFYRRSSILYSILLFKTRFFAFPLGIVLPLAAVGLLRHKRGSGSALLIWYLGMQFAATVAFFPCARYRITSIPVLLIFAALGAIELWKIVGDGTSRKSKWPLAIAGLTLIVSNGNLYGIDRRQDLIDSDTHYSIAEIMSKRGDMTAAEQECRKSLALNPRNGACLLNYSRVLLGLGRGEESRCVLTKCLELYPEYAAARAALGDLYASQGDLGKAVIEFETAARTDPGFADKLARISRAAYARGDYAVAERGLRALVTLRPTYAEARRSLGIVQMRLGKLDDAIAQLEEACRLEPGAAKFHLALGIAYHKAGRPAESRAAFDRAIAIGPADQVRAAIQRALGPQHESPP